ncbi:Cof-type HAD-IIB family hydrolase [Viridibacillus sp. YIM B01967]|uniref:Cof-type HAD-IIB family hydrolase n=1 Tax=Viridibacillus soli TaxID=2798301 RepID=A0ABS1H7K2_9BACL|nr:Cof-type HAD-IIB family hydrolase [Viridibacillus soli]MBK3495399.1 Cof-type HAD-IIB family hydrolase [Viridibacillus soli]
MQKRILFFDIDGTLYNSEKKIPQTTINAVKKAKANGHEVVIATGRAPFMIKEVLETLEVESYICFNGQYVVYKGRPVFRKPVPLEQLKALVDYVQKQHKPLVFLDDQEMVSSIAEDLKIKESLTSLHYPMPRLDKDFYLTRPIYQVLLFVNIEEEVQYEKTFPELQLIRWHTHSCDVLNKGVSKAYGIERLLEYTDFSMDDSIAFGDGLNDVEMLTAVGTGVAMGNGHEKAKTAATFVTEHVDKDGLVKAMEKLQLV